MIYKLVNGLLDGINWVARFRFHHPRRVCRRLRRWGRRWGSRCRRGRRRRCGFRRFRRFGVDKFGRADFAVLDFEHAPRAIFYLAFVDKFLSEFAVGRPKAFAVWILGDDHDSKVGQTQEAEGVIRRRRQQRLRRGFHRRRRHHFFRPRRRRCCRRRDKPKELAFNMERSVARSPRVSVVEVGKSKDKMSSLPALCVF